MKTKIDRTLIWFRNEEGIINQLGNMYFGMSTMLNRLLNQKYEGEKIKFINIYFNSKEVYIKNPATKRNHTHYYVGDGGYLEYSSKIDLLAFDKLAEEEQKIFIWKSAFECLRSAAKDIKNDELLESCEYAFENGMNNNLNPDYKLLESELLVNNMKLMASVWICFKNDDMYSKIKIEKNGEEVFSKELEKTKSGNEFFLVMYKGIETDGDFIFIKIRKDAGNSPLKIPLSEILK